MALRGLFCSVTQQPGHGGIARVSTAISQVMRNQPEARWDVLVAAPDTEALTGLQKVLFALRVLWRQLDHVDDTLFFDHLGLAMVQRWVPRRFRRRYGIFLHSVEVWGPLSPNRLRTLREATLRVANSNYTAKRIAAAHPSIGEIHVCHLTLGTDREKLAAEKIAHEQSPHSVLGQIRAASVLIVGRMSRTERHKGHDELLRAWPLVLRAVPDAQLVIVGGGDDVERYKKLVADLNIAEHVLFMGRVSDATLDVIYSRVALFAMPSRGEGFGIVYLEAMRHGLACVASTHDAAGEIVVDGETGFLVEPSDLSELASKLVELLLNPALRSELGKRGHERLQTHFSFMQFQARMTELLAQLQG